MANHKVVQKISEEYFVKTPGASISQSKNQAATFPRCSKFHHVINGGVNDFDDFIATNRI